jgi:hypothetical protein
MYSIYDNLIFLNNNNNIIDLTYDYGFFQNNFDSFLYDIELINKADCNIIIGLGGSLQLIQSFSKNNLCYICGEIDHISIQKILESYEKCNQSIYYSIDNFLNKINNEYSIIPIS